MHYFKLLLEPVALIWLGFIWLTFSLWRARAVSGRRNWRISVLLLLSFWFVASPLGANALVWLLERNYRSTQVCDGFAKTDAIVILGGGKKGSNADPDEIEALMETTLVRTYAGLRLWNQLERAPMVVLSGGGYGDVREADLMALLATQAGVAHDQLLLERDSMTTRQNAEGVGRLLSASEADSSESEKIFLVTSAMHMPRALATFSRSGFNVCPWPVDQRAFRPDFGGLWIPSIRPLQKSSMALHEFQGLLWYWIVGNGEAPVASQ